MMRASVEGRSAWHAALLMLICAAVPAFASADPRVQELSLDQAEALLMSQPHISQRLAAARARASGEQRAAGRWANPVLELSDESVSGGGQSEDERSIWIRQSLDLSRVRRQRSLAAAAEGGARVADTQHGVRLLIQQLRNSYFNALYWQQRTRLLADARTRIERLITMITEQVARGETAQFDLLRLEQQQVSVSAREAASAARADRDYQRLLALLGLGTQQGLRLTDPLIPPAPPDLVSLLEQLPRLPVLRAAQARLDAAQASLRAEQRTRIPEITLGLGHRTVESNGMEQDGALVALEVPLPLFDRRSDQRQIAASNVESTTAELTALQQQVAGDVRGLWAAATRLRGQAMRITEEAERSSSAMLMAAETGYAEAELSVLQLTDALDTVLSTLLNAHDLTWAARAAHNELHRYTLDDSNE